MIWTYGMVYFVEDKIDMTVPTKLRPRETAQLR